MVNEPPDIPLPRSAHEVIRLETRGRQLVSYQQIPRMVVPPEMVQWGGRFFIASQEQFAEVQIYREGLLWVIPPEVVTLRNTI